MLSADADRVVEARFVFGMIGGPEIVQEFHIYQELDMSACRKNNLLPFHADKMVRPTCLCPGIKELGLCCISASYPVCGLLAADLGCLRLGLIKSGNPTSLVSWPGQLTFWRVLVAAQGLAFPAIQKLVFEVAAVEILFLFLAAVYGVDNREFQK